MRRGALALIVLFCSAVGWSNDSGPHVVESIDLAKFMGTWYEVSHIPNFPQKNCRDTIVHYRLAPDGGFELLNTCWKSGKYKPYHGWAKPWEAGAKAKFRVKFFAIFGGDYWIIDVAPDYSWAAVGDSKRGQMWVMSRARTLDGKVYAGILERAKANGFDVTKLELTQTDGRTSPGFTN